MTDMYQILDPTGHLVAAPPDLPSDRLISLYRWMVLGRIFSDRMVALQRQGRMGTFAPLNGQEATCVGLAAPLQPEDWLMGSYRQSLPYMVKGAPLMSQLQHWGGYIPDYPYEARCLPFQIVLATQMLHAVGIAQAINYEGKPQVVVGVCGDGATSQGEFNEALNVAAVTKAPVIFVVENNGWAISVPREQQTVIERLADRGPGFGVPSRVVDGNDLLAMYQAVDEAADLARSGGGPTLIEAITYRMAAHTTADDPTRYQPPEELTYWAERDPIQRFRHHLLTQNILTDAQDEALYDDAVAEFEITVVEYEALPPQDVNQHFDLILADPPPQLRRQQTQLLREIGEVNNA